MSDSILLSDAQTLFQEVANGTKLYPLSYDAAFKKIFSPDHHPERLNMLLQGITGDNSIEVTSSRSNEGFIMTKDSKKVIFDIPAKLSDNRDSVTELQKTPQNYVVPRTEIYAANLLTNQYATEAGQAKVDVNYEKKKGIILVVLMVQTPKSFNCIPCPDSSIFHPYIQKVTHIVSDEGIRHDSLQKIYFVELDECLRQYEVGINLCNDAELQFILSAICDVNSPQVTSHLVDGSHAEIYNELRQMTYDKEAMKMLISEQLAHADWTTMEARIKELEAQNSLLSEQMAHADWTTMEAMVKRGEQQVENLTYQVKAQSSQLEFQAKRNAELEAEVAELKAKLAALTS